MPGPNDHAMPAKKAKNSKFAFRAFLKSVKPYSLPIIFSVFLAIGSAVLGIFLPKILGEITTSATTSFKETGAVEWDPIIKSITTFLILVVCSAILNYAQAYILAVTTAKYTKNLRSEIINKISRLPISYFDTHKHGDTISRVSNDIDILVTSMSQEIADITLSLTTLIGVTIMMLNISVELSIIAIVVIPVSVFCVGKITTKAQKYFREQQETLGALNGKIEESYSGQNIIKLYSHETASIKDFEKTNNKLTRAAWRAQFFSSLSIPVTHFFTNFGYVAICVMGGSFVLNGRIKIGDLQAFIEYVNRFNRPITEIASTTSTIQSLLAASERIFEFLYEKEEAPDLDTPQKIAQLKGGVEFKNIHFSYDGKNEIIKNFSVKIQPGQQVAIVGPTGAGKTTIINLLMRFYEPDSGEILIDDVPISQMSRADVRNLFGMVLQDTWLFSGTVLENLRYGKPNATLDEIKQCAKVSSVEHIIEALPHTYDTMINEDSDNISAGEKQLLTIARAMVANPPMIILDEATSNVDTRTEHLIQEAFEKLTKNRTSFVIAHRLSTIRNSDLILVMKDGNIIEQGNHDELLAQNGFYAELYNSQFADN